MEQTNGGILGEGMDSMQQSIQQSNASVIRDTKTSPANFARNNLNNLNVLNSQGNSPKNDPMSKTGPNFFKPFNYVTSVPEE